MDKESRKKRSRVKLHARNVRNLPVLSIFISNKHISAQVICEGRTLASASTVEKAVRDQLQKSSDIKAATQVGKFIAERAQSASVKACIFDRGSRRYHGKAKEIVESARQTGLII